MNRIVVAGLVLLALLLACGDPKPKETPDSNTVDRNVNALCEFFRYRTADDMYRDTARAEAEILMMRSGIPSPLRDKVRAMYLEPVPPPGSEARGGRYADVMYECGRAGYRL